MLRRLLNYLRPASQAVEPDAPISYYSRFGGLWTDSRTALDLLEAKARRQPEVAALKAKLAFFIKNGYVIFEQAVAHHHIDAYLHDLQNAAKAPGPMLASVLAARPDDKDVVPFHTADLKAPLTKLLDTYALLPTARSVIFSDPITRFLKVVFEDDLLAFQGLHFEKGSTQAIHQDTAYVVLEDPMKLCASWVALEDVKAGSGELIYYPGSHRLPDWLYSGEFKHFNSTRDPHAEHLAHLQALHDRSKERGLSLESFLPKKGDVLIWSSDLAHGGSQIQDPDSTRRSLVTHYTSVATRPYYFRFIEESRRKVVPVSPGCSYTTMYY